jgi:hypothetical protein
VECDAARNERIRQKKIEREDVIIYPDGIHCNNLRQDARLSELNLEHPLDAPRDIHLRRHDPGTGRADLRSGEVHPVEDAQEVRSQRLWCNSGFGPKVGEAICNDLELRSQRSSPDLWHRGFAATGFANLELPLPDLRRQLNSTDRHAGAEKLFKPTIARIRCFTRWWSFSIRLFKYLLVRAGTRLGSCHFSSTPPPPDAMPHRHPV